MLTINNLIKGKWYQLEWFDNNIYMCVYLLFDRLEDNKIYYTGNFIMHKKEEDSPYDYLTLDSKDIITEIDPSLIIDYLSNSNPYKKYYMRKQKIKTLLNNGSK